MLNDGCMKYCNRELGSLRRTVTVHTTTYFCGLINVLIFDEDRGSTVVKVLCYKSEGLWFDFRWCHWNFSFTYSFRSHYGPGVDTASNRNEYQEYFLGVKAAGA